MEKVFNFANFTDEELLLAEKESNDALGKALIQMIYNEELELMYSKVEAIREEKLRRKNGQTK